MRGKILKSIIERPVTTDELSKALKVSPVIVRKILAQLQREGFITKKKKGKNYWIA